MIIVDSNTWAAFFNGVRSPDVERLHAACEPTARLPTFPQWGLQPDPIRQGVRCRCGGQDKDTEDGKRGLRGGGLKEIEGMGAGRRGGGARHEGGNGASLMTATSSG